MRYYLKAFGLFLLALLICVTVLSLVADDCERRRGGVWTVNEHGKFTCSGAVR